MQRCSKVMGDTCRHGLPVELLQHLQAGIVWAATASSAKDTCACSMTQVHQHPLRMLLDVHFCELQVSSPANESGGGHML